MRRFWLPLTLSTLAEIGVMNELTLFGASLPLTLLALLLLIHNGWISPLGALLLAGVSGYVLDLIASPNNGRVVIAYVAAIGGYNHLSKRIASGRFPAWSAVAAAAVAYWLVLFSSFSIYFSWQVLLQLALYTAACLSALAIMQLTLKGLGRRL